MKKIILILGVMLALSSCGENFALRTHQYDKNTIAEYLPNGTEIGYGIGMNWWEGTYQGKKVLIHVIMTASMYTHVDLIFTGE